MSGKPIGKVAMTATERQRGWQAGVKKRARAALREQRRIAREAAATQNSKP
jgi:hypothetical protein